MRAALRMIVRQACRGPQTNGGCERGGGGRRGRRLVPRRSALRHGPAAAGAIVAIAAAVAIATAALLAPLALGSDAPYTFSPRDMLALDASDSAKYVAHIYTLSNAIDVDSLVLGNDTYAIVVAYGHQTVQLIRVHDNGTISHGHSTAGNYNFDHLIHRPIAIDAFVMGNTTYAIVASERSNSVQLLEVHGNASLLGPEHGTGYEEARQYTDDRATLLGADSAGNGTDGFDALYSPQGVDAFAVGNATYAIATSHWGHGIQLIRIHPNGTLSAADSAFNGTQGLVLSHPASVATFQLGNDTYAAVASLSGGAVQLVQVLANGTLSPANAAVNGERGFDALGGPQGIDAFKMGGDAYVIATSPAESAVQLIRVHSNGTMSAADSARDGVGGFDELYGASRVDAFKLDGRAYAAVASFADDGVQMIEIRADGTMSAAGSATDDAGGFGRLDGATAVAALEAGNTTYAMVASYGPHYLDSGVQLIRVGPPPPLFITGVAAAAADGAYAGGDIVNITVSFSGNVSVVGTPVLRLNSGGSRGVPVGQRHWRADVPLCGGACRRRGRPGLRRHLRPVGRSLGRAGGPHRPPPSILWVQLCQSGHRGRVGRPRQPHPVPARLARLARLLWQHTHRQHAADRPAGPAARGRAQDAGPAGHGRGRLRRGRAWRALTGSAGRAPPRPTSPSAPAARRTSQSRRTATTRSS